MDTRARTIATVAIILAVVGAVAGITVWLVPVQMGGGGFSPQGVTNFDSIHLSDSGGTATPVFIANQTGTGKVAEFQDASTVLLDVRDGGGVVVVQPTSVATAVPGLVIDNQGAVGNSIEIRTNATPVWSMSGAGAISQTGDQTVSGNLIVAGPTAATTATPMISANTAADAPDLMVISKDATPVVFVHNSGEVEFDGAINADSTLDVDGATNLDDLDIDLTASLNIDGHMVDIGTCTTPSTADGDNDLCVAADLEVDGELELDGALDADSTSDFADTVTFSKGAAAAVVIAAGGTISLPATSDLYALGYTTVGNGTPDGSVTAGTDEQLYVEGAFEVDGEAEFDGVIDADSTSDFADTATFSKGSGNAVVISAGGTLSLPATADLSAGGYANVGNGTPDGSVTAGTDEQLYVEGAFEVDGEAEFDGAVDMDSTATLAGVLTLEAGGKIKPSTVTTGTVGVVFNCSGTHTHSSAETAVDICDLPANANVVDVGYLVTTDWNDGATATVNCGIEGGDDNAFLAAHDVNGTGDGTYARMGSGATMPVLTSLIDVGASDVTVQCVVAEGNNDASEGSATLYIWYIID